MTAPVTAEVSSVAKPTILFDGSCPMCRAEIGHYRRLDRADALCFVDVSRDETPLPADLTRAKAMARFHITTADGRLLSGAAAFVEVWKSLPGWRWLALLAAIPGFVAVLEVGYRWTLVARPWLVRAFVRLQRSRP